MSRWLSIEFTGRSQIDRPASTQAAIRQKDIERQEILSAVELYIASGGSIKTIPSTISRSHQLIEMREGKVPLISFDDLAIRWDMPHKSLNGLINKYPNTLYILLGDTRHFAVADIERIEKAEKGRFGQIT